MCDHLPNIGLVDLLARTEEEGDCLVWTGHAAEGRFPQWRINGKLWLVRRLLWELTRGPIRAKHQIGVRCGVELCVHPECLVSRSKAAVMKGKPKTLKTRMNIAIGRRKGSRFDQETIRAIRAAEGQAKEVDALFGLPPGYASRIKRGTVWADHSSPFAGLGVR